jgi:hypothetical protein
MRKRGGFDPAGRRAIACAKISTYCQFWLCFWRRQQQMPRWPRWPRDAIKDHTKFSTRVLLNLVLLNLVATSTKFSSSTTKFSTTTKFSILQLTLYSY